MGAGAFTNGFHVNEAKAQSMQYDNKIDYYLDGSGNLWETSTCLINSANNCNMPHSKHQCKILNVYEDL